MLAKFEKESKKKTRHDKLEKEEQEKWDKQEEEAAKVFKGERTIGSGSKPFYKSDVKSEHFQVECKDTESRNWTFKVEWLEKISDEAYGRKRLPAMHLKFESIDKRYSPSWVMVPEYVFERMIGNEQD